MLQQICLYEITGGTLPMCQNTTIRVNGTWIKMYCLLCSKTYNTLHSCHNFPASSRQAARGALICETSLLQHGLRSLLLQRHLCQFWQCCDEMFLIMMSHSRVHFVYAPSQWETTLQCNVVSHWLVAYKKVPACSPPVILCILPRRVCWHGTPGSQP